MSVHNWQNALVWRFIWDYDTLCYMLWALTFTYLHVSHTETPSSSTLSNFVSFSGLQSDKIISMREKVRPSPQASIFWLRPLTPTELFLICSSWNPSLHWGFLWLIKTPFFRTLARRSTHTCNTHVGQRGILLVSELSDEINVYPVNLYTPSTVFRTHTKLWTDWTDLSVVCPKTIPFTLMGNFRIII